MLVFNTKFHSRVADFGEAWPLRWGCRGCSDSWDASRHSGSFQVGLLKHMPVMMVELAMIIWRAVMLVMCRNVPKFWRLLLDSSEMLLPC